MAIGRVLHRDVPEVTKLRHPPANRSLRPASVPSDFGVAETTSAKDRAVSFRLPGHKPVKEPICFTHRPRVFRVEKAQPLPGVQILAPAERPRHATSQFGESRSMGETIGFRVDPIGTVEADESDVVGCFLSKLVSFPPPATNRRLFISGVLRALPGQQTSARRERRRSRF